MLPDHLQLSTGTAQQSFLAHSPTASHHRGALLRGYFLFSFSVMIGAKWLQAVLNVHTHLGHIHEGRAQLVAEIVCVTPIGRDLVSLYAYYNVPEAAVLHANPYDCDDLVLDKAHPDAYSID